VGEIRGAPLRQADLLEDLTEEQEELLVDYYTSTGGDSGSVREAGTELASTAKDQGQEVASAAKEHGQQVASMAKEQTQRVAATAKQQGQQVLRSTADQAGEVVGTAKQQAGQVAQQASAEARNLLDETRSRLEDQTADGAKKMGENLSRLGDRAYGVSDDVRTRGIGGVLADVQSFARRRPGVFLLGTAVVGVMAGRAVRNAQGDDGGQELAAPPRGANGRTPSARAGTRGGR
jgi:ElaB/YqjD/DUF883 family membrane-anchored ribosome-binding protein